MEHKWITEESDRASGVISNISDTMLHHLVKKYQPLYNKAGKLYKIKLPDLRSVSFIWDPLIISTVNFSKFLETETIFPCGYYGLFKPSIAEILCQVPDKVLNNDTVNAFYIDTSLIKIFTTGSAQLANVVWGTINE